MNVVNGHSTSEVGSEDPVPKSASPAIWPPSGTPAQFTPEQVKECVARLEIPFDPSVIDWRVTNTAKAARNEILRGQAIPYADQRAYTDRLNAIFSPAGWTRKYTVHTSANFQRSKDEKTVAKVFVTCELTIFGLGSHSATGEEWTDDENAGTSAEAQAFKRACSCFGLGRYLYYFTGVWVDLDDRKRPKTMPRLAGWATPDGWSRGLRPGENPPVNKSLVMQPQHGETGGALQHRIRQIEAMEQMLGKGLYRGLLKSVAKVWKPSDIEDREVLERLLKHVQAAERGLRRLEAAYLHTGAQPLEEILHSLEIRDMDQVNSLELLQKVVLALEAKAKITSTEN
jgi:hypothetical protein